MLNEEMMLHALSWLCASLLALIGLLHLYWALGGRAGHSAALPRRESGAAPVFVPGKVETALVAVVLWGAGGLLLAQSELLPLYEGNGWTRWGCLLCAIVFSLRVVGDFRYMGLTKRVKGSVFAKLDTALYIPLCLLLAAGFWLAFAAA